MATKKNKKKIVWQQYISVVFFVLIGMVCGVLMINYLDSVSEGDMSLGDYLIFLGLPLIEIYVIFFLQVIIHEAGHLIFGLLTGYRFLSFRIGSFMWVREDGRLRFKRMSLAGTGGQCLMSPPDMVNGKMPFVLYNLGGSFMNLLSGLVFLGAYLLLKDVTHISVFFLLASAIGFAFSLMNGIPIRLGTVDNDGYNMLAIAKSSDALRSFWVQMKTIQQISKGVRIKDMPEEWFTVPSDEGMKNSMTAVMGVFAANRLIDVHTFDEAADLIDRLLKMDSAIVGLHRSLMTCDRIYCELIGETNKERLDTLLEKHQRQFMKSMKKFPSVIRTEYAYALLKENNEEKAGHLKEQFEKCAISYPYQSDIESERELIQIAQGEVIRRSSAVL